MGEKRGRTAVKSQESTMHRPLKNFEGGGIRGEKDKGDEHPCPLNGGKKSPPRTLKAMFKRRVLGQLKARSGLGRFFTFKGGGNSGERQSKKGKNKKGPPNWCT